MAEGETTSRTRGRFGPYKIVAPLGRGGMGVVYRAIDVSLNRVVALKVLHDHLRTRPQCVSRLQREARAVAGLNHPNIVQVYSVGEVGKIGYFAMEYIEGRPLSTILAQEGPMPWERALHICGQIADALACAHEAQIVHRDVKPPNIIIAENDRVYVTDFGVAKVLTAETHLTVDASRLGTPSYMSPEHCQNKEVTAASDFYSLGVLMFQMISGRLPHEASTRAALAQKIIGSPPARLRDYVPDVPEGVDRLVAYLLEKRPKDRPSNGRVVMELIERVSMGATLDEDCGERVAVLETLRESLATPSGEDAARGKGRNGLSSNSDATSTQGFLLQPKRWLRENGSWQAVVWVLVIWGGICSAITGTLVAQWDPPELMANTGAGALTRWQASAAVADFSEAAPGVTLAALRVPGRFVVNAGWLEPGASALMLSGRDSAPGLVQCILEPGMRRAAVYEIPSPSGYGPLQAVLGFGGAIGGDKPLGDRLLALFAGVDSAYGGLAAIAPPPRDAFPLAASIPTGATASPWANVAATRLNGDAVAYVTGAPDGSGTWVVSQQLVDFAGPSGKPYPLTRAGAPVAAMQYSPDGARLAYQRQPQFGPSEIWLVRTDGSELEGTMIVRGNVALGTDAFSPDGTRLAILNGPANRGRQLQIYHVNGAAMETAGEACGAAWHPSGNYIVVTAFDDARLQLWTVRTLSPYSRAPLTQLPAGVTPPCYIAPDGNSVLAFLAEVDTPTAVFVDLRNTR